MWKSSVDFMKYTKKHKIKRKKISNISWRVKVLNLKYLKVKNFTLITILIIHGRIFSNSIDILKSTQFNTATVSDVLRYSSKQRRMRFRSGHVMYVTTLWDTEHNAISGELEYYIIMRSAMWHNPLNTWHGVISQTVVVRG